MLQQVITLCMVGTRLALVNELLLRVVLESEVFKGGGAIVGGLVLLNDLRAV